MAFWDNPNVHSVGSRALGTLNDFQQFILRGNVVDLAVGIVIGAAFTTVVNAFVADLITPLIGIFGGFDFPNYAPAIGKSIFRIGAFINAVISFLLIALVVYFFVVKPVNVMTARFKPKEATAPTTRDCPFCLSSVPLQATRCAYCTAQLPPADQASAATAQGV